MRMKLTLFFACLTVLAALCCADKKGGLQIGVKKRPETCDMRSKKGDKLSMHYTVSLLVLLFASFPHGPTS
jgi:hypothetical protein